MEIIIIIALVVLSVVLLLVELFVMPGLSIAGIAAMACAAFDIYYAFARLGVIGGVITLLVLLIVCMWSLLRFMRSKTLDKLSLKQNIDSHVDRNPDIGLKVGAKGISTTRLAQIGYADFDGNVVEVKSQGGFIDEQTAIVIRRIHNGTIEVAKCDS